MSLSVVFNSLRTAARVCLHACVCMFNPSTCASVVRFEFKFCMVSMLVCVCVCVCVCARTRAHVCA